MAEERQRLNAGAQNTGRESKEVEYRETQRIRDRYRETDTESPIGEYILIIFY